MVFATLGKRHRCRPSADDSPPRGVRRATKVSSLGQRSRLMGETTPLKIPQGNSREFMRVRELANTGCLASESRPLEEFFHLQALSPFSGKLKRPTDSCGMSVIGTHSRSLASGVTANRKKSAGVADMRIWRNLPGGFIDEPGWDLRHSASASSEADSCWAKGSCLNNLPSGAQLVTCNKKRVVK